MNKTPSSSHPLVPMKRGADHYQKPGKCSLYIRHLWHRYIELIPGPPDCHGPAPNAFLIPGLREIRGPYEMDPKRRHAAHITISACLLAADPDPATCKSVYASVPESFGRRTRKTIDEKNLQTGMESNSGRQWWTQKGGDGSELQSPQTGTTVMPEKSQQDRGPHGWKI